MKTSSLNSSIGLRNTTERRMGRAEVKFHILLFFKLMDVVHFLPQSPSLSPGKEPPLPTGRYRRDRQPVWIVAPTATAGNHVRLSNPPSKQLIYLTTTAQNKEDALQNLVAFFNT
jgi:hypothetical protein